MKRLFGTDGIRAVAGEYPLDAPSIHALGGALVGLLREEGLAPDVLIGRDTRESGPWMEAALAGGIQEAGGHPMSAGVIPTSAVSTITNRHHFNAGVVISASHNPYHDNGIKIFSSVGHKISDAWEARLEDVVLRAPKRGARKEAAVRTDPAFGAEYAAFLEGALAGVAFPRKLKVALDCANGAASAVAPDVLRKLGLEVVAGGCSPDGKNINKGCGSLHPHDLARTVVKARADIGIAYDGDADRALWVDETGRILNGDHTLFVLARFMVGRGRLKTSSVVATGMSNMGLDIALRKCGGKIIKTDVGDRYVVEAMRSGGYNLGGEQSGHMIFLDYNTTGDGILSALQLLAIMRREEKTLSELAEIMIPLPQVLCNTRVREKVDIYSLGDVASKIKDVEKKLGDQGRVLIRYSGTEPLLRVMIEGQDTYEITSWANELCDLVKKHIGEK